MWKKCVFTSCLALLFFFVPGNVLIAGELEPAFPGYPELFDISGTVDVAGQNNGEIIIDDQVFKFTSATTFHTPAGKADSDSFTAGDRVGFILEDSSSRNIISLWLLQEQAKSLKKKETGSEEMIFEEGVWKN